MPKPVRLFIRYVDAINRVVGIAAMYMIIAMIAVLFYSAISKAFFIPPLWALEISQFMMVAYFLLGGGYSIQMRAHVRMDLVYDTWKPRTRAIVDAVTVCFLIFYLVILLYGGISSTSYALEYGERSYSAWRPYMAPIKIIMCIGITLTLLQAVATFFRNVAEARGEPLA